MSRADKMFEDLGYKKISDDKYRTVYTFDGSEIVFQNRLKEVLIDDLTIQEHLAIHEKLKELGWIKQEEDLG